MVSGCSWSSRQSHRAPWPYTLCTNSTSYRCCASSSRPTQSERLRKLSQLASRLCRRRWLTHVKTQRRLRTCAGSLPALSCSARAGPLGVGVAAHHSVPAGWSCATGAPHASSACGVRKGEHHAVDTAAISSMLGELGMRSVGAAAARLGDLHTAAQGTGGNRLQSGTGLGL